MPAGSAAQSPIEDSVTGSARDCTDPPSCLTNPTGLTLFTSITANAHSGPSGENPSGTMSWGERIVGGPGFLDSQDRVTCLSVSDNVAVVGVAGTTNLVRFGITLWNVGLIRVTDGGGPNSELDTFQFAIQTQPIVFPPPPPPPDPTDCSTFPSGVPALRNEEGDLTVTDAKPFPTSKDQCKNGGWQSYSTFKNQGDCVSFVATGGKNPPANSP
jgi:hypothetical protein